jgi:pimeloyl-ACP methyl ester carboxylesterase
MEGTSAHEPAWLPEWHRRRALAADPETTAAIFLRLFEAETDKTIRPAGEQYLARRACPVLTVSVAASLKVKGIDEQWDRTVSRHPSSDSVAWDGVGHWLFQERPGQFNTLVLEWIIGLRTPAARH